MKPDLWPRIEDALGDAMELPPAERPAFLRARLAHDPDALRYAERLLSNAPAAERFFEQAPLDAWRLHPGVRLGPWQLERTLGAGGMGMVWLARRIDGQADMLAAIKILPPALVGTHEADNSLRRRFLAEKRILAQLDHPNIARLLDAGAGSGDTHNFVMEYVDGVPLLAYAAVVPDRSERLRLFAKICHAVEYAHSKLVVHRDLKPQNILVQENGEPKLLDFGIARLLSDAPADGAVTLMRAYSVDYASPEQLCGEAIGTATDVYSLGLVLYEWITGVRARNWSNLSLIDAATSSKTFTPPPHALLDRDLLAVVRKAANPEVALRYRSVSELAADVERLIDGLPVEARTPHAAERAVRFLRRHWIAASVTAAVFAVVTGSAVSAWSSARQARADRAIAQEKTRQLEAAVQTARQQSARAIEMSTLAAESQEQTERRVRDLLDVFYAMVNKTRRDILKLPGGTKAGYELIRQGLADIEKLQPGDRLRPHYLHVRAHAHTILRDLAWGPNSNLGDRAASAAHARASAALWRELHELQPRNLTAHVNRLQSEFALVRWEPPTNKAAWSEWERRFNELIAIAPNDRPAISAVAAFHFWAGARPEAPESARHLDTSIELNQRGLALAPSDPTFLRSLAISHKYRSNDKSLPYEKARHHAFEALRLDRERAEASLEDASAKLDVAFSIGALADTEARFGHDAAAVPLFQESLKLRTELRAGDPENTRVAGSIRYPIIAGGRAAAKAANLPALREFVAAFEGLTKTPGFRSSPVDVGTVELWRAQIALAEGRSGDACRHFDAALAVEFWEVKREEVAALRARSCRSE